MADEPVIVEEEKCGDEDMHWRPFGGAISFKEADTWAVNQAMAEYVNETTNKWRALMDNIMQDDMMSIEQKASAAADLTKEFQQLIESPDKNELSDEQEELMDEGKSKSGFLGKLFGAKRNYSTAQRQEMAKRGQALPDGSYPIANEQDLKNAIRAWGRGGAKPSDKAHIMKRARALGKTDLIPEGWKSLEDENTVTLPANRGFKVYRDLEGDLRWLSLSSNAFEDLDKELFTTKALEEAIEHADKTGERGPLLIYHVPSAVVGQCDYQAMAGRFLVESGTFDDTPLGNKAVEYFMNSDEEHQVSIGYEYRLGDEEDGIYEWTRIKERSVCPYGAAANPWTDFKVIGENPMDARKTEALEKIFGKELAAGVIATAEERTKELEGTTKFKELKEEPFSGTLDEYLELKAKTAVKEALDAFKESDSPWKEEALEKAKKMTPEEEAAMKKDMAKKEGDPDPKPEPQPDPEPAPTFGSEQLTQLATLLTDMSNQINELSGIKTVVEELQTQVKELSKSEEQKMLEVIQPKWNGPVGQRPTESEKNVVTDPEAVKTLNMDSDNVSNPAVRYVEDLLGRAVASN